MKHFGWIILSAALFAVGIPVAVSAQAISESTPSLEAHAASPEKFIPAGWLLWEIRKGDLNKDGISDAVLIMRRSDNDRAHRLAAVFGNSAGGFDLAAENGKVLNGTRDGNFNSYPNSDGFKMRLGAFTMQMSKDVLEGLRI